MGSCLSKKDCSSSSPPPVVATLSATQKPQEKLEPDTKVGDESLVKKEIFVIKHRKSHDKRPCEESGKDSASSDGIKSKPKPKPKPKSGDESEVSAGAETSTTKVNEAAPAAAHAPSSKEEVDVDAILIQCGRLSRSSSGTGNPGTRRNYSGSKRSYDFDANNDVPIMADGTRNANHYSDDEDELRRHRQSRPSPSASTRRRRRTPSREREGEKDERSSSRERGINGNGGRRRVSRSPGRRSSEVTTATANATASTTTGGRPGKMVSVPATVSSLVMDKSNIAEPQPQANSNSNSNAVKRISVKRNVGDPGPVGPRGTASPRSQSPAATRAGSNNKENQQQQAPSLSRNNSRKAEQSPYRRNPLSEIDNNTICNSKANSRIASKNKEMECQEVHRERESINASLNQKQIVDTSNERFAPQHGNGCKTTSVRDLQQKIVAGEHGGQETIAAAATTPIASTALTRSSSSRLSGPGLEPEVPVKPISYTSLLLEDIQNFHQKNAAAPLPIPACVTKACSIYEAVAELNSKKTPSVSKAQMESRLDHVSNQYSTNEINYSSNVDFVKKKKLQSRDPFVESELSVGDDLMEPSIHKYVTVHRGGGTLGADDKEERESSGSNSFVGNGLQQLGISSTWEPGSADSSECWTSHSNNNTKGRDQSPFGNERCATPESGNFTDNAARKLNGRRRDVALQPKPAAGRGRI